MGTSPTEGTGSADGGGDPTTRDVQEVSGRRSEVEFPYSATWERISRAMRDSAVSQSFWQMLWTLAEPPAA